MNFNIKLPHSGSIVISLAGLRGYLGLSKPFNMYCMVKLIRANINVNMIIFLLSCLFHYKKKIDVILFWFKYGAPFRVKVNLFFSTFMSDFILEPEGWKSCGKRE